MPISIVTVTELPGLIQVLQTEGIRQTELAEDSKISLGTINRVCNGKQKITRTTMGKIVKSINRLSGECYEISDVFFSEKKKDAN